MNTPNPCNVIPIFPTGNKPQSLILFEIINLKNIFFLFTPETQLGQDCVRRMEKTTAIRRIGARGSSVSRYLGGPP